MPPVYPVNDYGPLMPGLVMAGVAIVHVFLAQFAVGGGLLLCYLQFLAMTGRNAQARQFVGGYFKVLVLISFVLGALTGVGIWFTAIQVSAPTIGAMVQNFHWLWATEWTFFCLEIASGYLFYRFQERISDRASLALLALYAFAAWMSLFIINGIISWQLTPGRWLETSRLADGFFNLSFWPSLFFRTIVATTLAALVACVVVNAMRGMGRAEKKSLINSVSAFLVPMALMPALGLWFLAAMPADSRGWVTGGSPAMTLFLSVSIAASLAIGGYALIGLVGRKLYINGATATLLVLLAFGATAGGEFVREGARKPYSIRQVLYSTGIRPGDVARLREVGCLADDPYPLSEHLTPPNDQINRGARVFRRLCGVCHAVAGVNGVVDLTKTWDVDQMRMNIAKLQQTKPFMPPFAGTPEELESLVQFIKWTGAGRPDAWPEHRDEEVLTRIERWLAEAGTSAAVPTN